MTDALSALGAPDSLSNPNILALVKSAVTAGTKPDEVIRTVVGAHYGLPSLCNLLLDWIDEANEIAGGSAATSSARSATDALIGDAFRSLYLLSYNNNAAQEIFSLPTKEAQALSHSLTHALRDEAWRATFQQLINSRASSGGDSAFLGFVAKQLAIARSAAMDSDSAPLTSPSMAQASSSSSSMISGGVSSVPSSLASSVADASLSTPRGGLDAAVVFPSPTSSMLNDDGSISTNVHVTFPVFLSRFKMLLERTCASVVEDRKVGSHA